MVELLPAWICIDSLIISFLGESWSRRKLLVLEELSLFQLGIRIQGAAMGHIRPVAHPAQVFKVYRIEVSKGSSYVALEILPGIATGIFRIQHRCSTTELQPSTITTCTIMMLFKPTQALSSASQGLLIGLSLTPIQLVGNKDKAFYGWHHNCASPSPGKIHLDLTHSFRGQS